MSSLDPGGSGQCWQFELRMESLSKARVHDSWVSLRSHRCRRSAACLLLSFRSLPLVYPQRALCAWQGCSREAQGPPCLDLMPSARIMAGVALLAAHAAQSIARWFSGVEEMAFEEEVNDTTWATETTEEA
eukprot:2049280-Amphidinium_carterae.1